ncbi:MAG: hypothetical protein JXA77_14655 [Bacteroidales bacterium]|nr:hypothetical protein [Bacteroidales bacterium]MBN2821095.1 hypothetical protein [Bacteroidales bacterium]
MAKKKKQPVFIHIGQQLTIEYIDAIYNELTEAFQKKVGIKMETLIEEIDLTGIQLLLFTRKKAEQENIDLDLKIKYSDNVRNLLSSTGFAELLP